MPNSRKSFITLSMHEIPIYRSFTGALVILLLASACSTTTKTSTAQTTSPVVSLPGYVVKDSNFSRKDFNVWVVTTEPYFDSLFTAVIVNPSRPEFGQQLVVAVKVETATASYKVNFKNMTIRRQTLNVYFNVTKEKPDSENTGWVSVSTYPRNRNLRRVNFYFDDVLIRSIPVVIVY